MRAAALLSSEPKVSRFEHYLDESFEKVGDFYRKLLAITLKWKYSVVFSSIAFFVLSLFLVAKVRQEFVPLQDQNLIIMSAQAKPGTSLNATSDEALKIEEILKKDPNVMSYLISIGAGGGASTVNQMFVPIILQPREKRSLGHIEIMEILR